jgi:hypothetical protein
MERQRERIVALLRADPSRSLRSVAREVGCGTSTVSRTRERYVSRDVVDGTAKARHPGSANLIEPAGPGNQRAITHGAYSAARREPLEQQHRHRLRQSYPSVADDLINASAKRAAMIDLFSAWIYDAGAVHAHRGLPAVSDPARELRRLLSDHEAAIERLEALEHEAQRVDPGEALRRHVAQINAENGGDGGVHAD